MTDENVTMEQDVETMPTQDVETMPTQSIKASVSKAVEIEQVTINGEILAVDEIIVDGELKGVMVKIYDIETSKKYDVITSDGMLEAFKSNGGKYRDLVVQGTNVSATLDKNLGLDLHPESRATSYLDKEGNKQYHKRTGYSLRELLPMGSFQTAKLTIINNETAKKIVANNSFEGDANQRIAFLTRKGMSEERAIEIVFKTL